MPQPTAILIDSVNKGQLAPELQGPGVIVWNNNLYIFLFPNEGGSSSGAYCMKSTDGGATWARQDASNEPVGQAGCSSWDGTSNLVRVLFTEPSVGGNWVQPMKWRDFDMDTDTWSSVHGSGPSGIATFVGYRSDGSVVVTFRWSADVFAHAGLFFSYAVYDPIGDSWGSPIALDTEIRGMSGFNTDDDSVRYGCVIIGPNDELHVFASVRSILGFGVRMFYIPVSNIDVVGTVFEFPGNTGLSGGEQPHVDSFGNNTFGQGVIVGDQIIIPVTTRKSPYTNDWFLPNYFVGTPVASPSWTLFSANGMDSQSFSTIAFRATEPPVLILDGVTLRAVWIRGSTTSQPVSGEPAQVRTAFTTDLSNLLTATWTLATYYDWSLDAGINSRTGTSRSSTMVYFPTIRAVNGQLLYTIDITGFTPDPFEARYMISSYTPNNLRTSQVVDEAVGSPEGAETTQSVYEIVGEEDGVEAGQVVDEIVGASQGAEVSQAVLEAFGLYQVGQASQSVIEAIGRNLDAQVSQVVIEVFGGFGKIRTSQTVIELVAGFGAVRASQTVLEIVCLVPLPKLVTLSSNRGKVSSMRFGIGGYVTVEGLVTQQLSPVVPVDPVNIIFRPVRTRLSARYSGSQVVDILDGRPSFIAPWNSVRLTADPTDQITNVLAGEEGRLDIISFQMYGREDLWWAIAQANDIQNPFEEPLAGDRIRIPALARILRVLGQSGTGTEVNRFKP